ncbi:MAG: DUF5131 family protein [Ruminococcaceae bacterium]|nr:DUF5131 family protein [Oscillospiraceae bacterium]
MSASWNPWHGCKRVSEGCLHCYVYRMDEAFGKNGGEIRINSDFLLPLRESKGQMRIPSGETVYTCFSSDFLLEDADQWRPDAWRMMRLRQDLRFVFFTKRIERLADCLPKDWGEGYPNVVIGCTCETQKRADERLPVFLSLPIAERWVICEPILEFIDLEKYLANGGIAEVSVGGESGDGARVCDFAWVQEMYNACLRHRVRFSYHQTGALLRKNGRLYRIPREQQHAQAQRAMSELQRLAGC